MVPNAFPLMSLFGSVSSHHPLPRYNSHFRLSRRDPEACLQIENLASLHYLCFDIFITATITDTSIVATA